MILRSRDWRDGMILSVLRLNFASKRVFSGLMRTTKESQPSMRTISARASKNPGWKAWFRKVGFSKTRADYFSLAITLG